MGLDQYLHKKTYVKNWEHMKPEERHTVAINGPMASTIKKERINYIEEEVMYWRKANQIHHWFDVNCDDEEESNCKEIYVSREKLEELVETCKKVLASTKLVAGKICESYSFGKDGKIKKNMVKGKVLEDSSVAKKLLPAQEGFFFGSTDYDEWYWNDLKRTVEVLEKELENDPEGEYYYFASW